MALDGCDVSQSHSIKNVWSPAGQVGGHAGDDLDDVDDVIAGCCDVGVDDDDDLDDGDDGGEGEYGIWNWSPVGLVIKDAGDDEVGM